MTVLLAQSLAMNSTNSAALKQIEMMYTSVFVVTAEEHKGLDQRLLSAFKQQQLPDSWGLITTGGMSFIILAIEYSIINSKAKDKVATYTLFILTDKNP